MNPAGKVRGNMTDEIGQASAKHRFLLAIRGSKGA
jgi:hypothetical protein